MRPAPVVAMAVGACFYVRPIPEVSRNLPPQIVVPEGGRLTVLPDAGATVLTVIATDPNDDALTCDWPDLAGLTVSFDVFDADAERVCQATLLAPDELGGGRTAVRALVGDGEPDNTVTVTFTVERP